MAGMDDNQDVGGGTPPLGGSLADEEAAMKSGKWRMMAAIIGTCVAVVVLAVWLMAGTKGYEEYVEVGKTVNGVGIKGNFDSFWGCALQGVDLRDLDKAEDLIAQIAMRGSDGRVAYGKHVSANCVNKLSDMQTKLDVLTVPQELQTDVKGMKDASSQLRGAWSSYMAYLADSKDSYDEDEARDKIKNIARGWYEFKKAHSSLNKKLKEKLE
jgi:hypothetical protein